MDTAAKQRAIREMSERYRTLKRQLQLFGHDQSPDGALTDSEHEGEHEPKDQRRSRD